MITSTKSDIIKNIKSIKHPNKVKENYVSFRGENINLLHNLTSSMYKKRAEHNLITTWHILYYNPAMTLIKIFYFKQVSGKIMNGEFSCPWLGNDKRKLPDVTLLLYGKF
jgi:hypothetical protein